MKKILVFDMDGTLLDTMGMWKKLSDDLGDKLHLLESVDPLPAEEGSMVEYCYRLVKNNFPHANQESMHRIIHDHLLDFYSRNDLCKPNVYEQLEEFYKNGYEMYVATATDYFFAETGIRSNGLNKFIKKIYTPDTVNYSKGNEEYFKYFINEIGVSPDNIIFFDDALYANQLANKLGLVSVGIFDEYSYNNEEVKEEADFFIKDFNEINSLMLI